MKTPNPRAIKTHLRKHGFRIVTPSASLVRYWMSRINIELWDGRLPPPRSIKIRRDGKFWAWTSFPESGHYGLEFDSYPLTKKRFIEVLVHESVHAYLYAIEGDARTVHGPEFMKYRHKVRHRFNLSLTKEIKI